MLAVFTIFFQTYRVVLYLSIFEGRHRCSFTVNVIEQKMKKNRLLNYRVHRFGRTLVWIYFTSNQTFHGHFGLAVF